MNAHFDMGSGTPELLVMADEEARLAQLMETIAQNESLPAPAPENVFVGDGDYRAIGARVSRVITSGWAA